MKIFLDIGHPAHVHYFRNSIKILQEKGHEFLITARNKDVTIQLLDYYKINHYNRGKGHGNIIGKILYLLKTNFILFFLAKRFSPDIFLSFASPYAAQVAFLLNKDHIAFTDTEHAKLGIISFLPFSKFVLTPAVYKGDLGKKHIRFDGFMEQCYMDKKNFKKSVHNLDKLKFNKTVFIRLVSWTASHDIGESGFANEELKFIIKSLEVNTNILISCEGKIPEEFKKYQIMTEPHEIHNLLNYVDLFIGEGATMASECAMIGTPAIYVNSLTAGTIIEQEKYNLVHRFGSSLGVIDKALKILNNQNSKIEYEKRSEKLLSNQIDVNHFINSFIINYPKSAKLLQENPDYKFNS